MSDKLNKKFHSIIGKSRKGGYTNHYSNDTDILIGDEAYSKSSVMDITNVINIYNYLIHHI